MLQHNCGSVKAILIAFYRPHFYDLHIKSLYLHLNNFLLQDSNYLLCKFI